VYDGYGLDNVSLQSAPSPATDTTCVDPTVAAPQGGADSPTILVNGDFASGTIEPGWSLFGAIVGGVTAGVFEFIRPAGTPSGVLLQSTGQIVGGTQLLTASFQLGNTSAVRKRVTVILHDADFSDLSACTFWLAPGQPLSTYTYRTFVGEVWSNATLSFYPATIGTEEWIQLDNVTLQRTPSAAIAGTECLEPAASPDTVARPRTDPPPRAGADGEAWIADGFESPASAGRAVRPPDWIGRAGVAPRILTGAEPIDLDSAGAVVLTFESWLSSSDVRATVQVSFDGYTWEIVQVVPPSDTWVTVSVPLRPHVGRTVMVRFVLESVGADDPGFWALDRIRREAVRSPEP
jgi:hypothetical protein